MRSIKRHLLGISILVLLGLGVFREYFIGTRSPSWDFLTDYFTASYVWWNAGSFFNPPSYLPYAFSGFPAHLSGQAANWYLPVGFLAELKIYNIHTSAILQALTIIFGIIGIYFLANSWGVSRYISILLAVGYLFSPGFFTSASHIDIVRGWAFMPWVLLALKPHKRISSLLIFGISLLAFQFMVGVYPGIIIASVYMLAIYVIFNLYFENNLRKSYLTYQLLPFLLGVSLSLLKWLPLVSAERLYRGGNSVEVTSAILSTLIYPYDTIILPNDITMRSFFLAPILMISLFLIQRINKQIVIFTTIGIAAIVLGFDISETSRWQESLPFLGESRFRTTDFKLFWILSAILLAGFALQQAKEKGISFLRALLALGAGFATFTLLNRLAKTALLEDMLRPGNTFARTAGFVFVLMLVFFIMQRYLKFGSNIAIGLALVGTIFIGISWSEVSKTPWNNDRQGIEQVYYGMALDKRIGEGLNREISLRPSRVGPEFPIPYPIQLTSQMWSNSEINRSFSLGGYVPLKGIPRYEEMIEFAKTEESIPFYALLAKEQAGWITSTSEASKDTVNCIYQNNCIIEKSSVVAESWDLNKLQYGVQTSQPGLLVVNEIPWEGWKAEVCSSLGCETTTVKSDLKNLLLAVEISTDTEKVTFEYFQPLKRSTWIIFWLGILGIIYLMFKNKTSARKVG